MRMQQRRATIEATSRHMCGVKINSSITNMSHAGAPYLGSTHRANQPARPTTCLRHRIFRYTTQHQPNSISQLHPHGRTFLGTTRAHQTVTHPTAPSNHPRHTAASRFARGFLDGGHRLWQDRGSTPHRRRQNYVHSCVHRWANHGPKYGRVCSCNIMPIILEEHAMSTVAVHTSSID